MREQIQVHVELCRPEARLPQYAHPDDAGTDILKSKVIVKSVHIGIRGKIYEELAVNKRLTSCFDFLSSLFPCVFADAALTKKCGNTLCSGCAEIFDFHACILSL